MAGARRPPPIVGYAGALAPRAALADRGGDGRAGEGLGPRPPPVRGPTNRRWHAAYRRRSGRRGHDPEGVGGPPDWRALLDLLEARSGQDLVPLWREWVVRPDEAAMLDARAQARTSYERTLALADGWQLPRAIRDALRSWQFDTAETLMADARTVLAQRKAVAGIAERDGVPSRPRCRRCSRAARWPRPARMPRPACRDAGDRGRGSRPLGRRRHPEPDRHARRAPGAEPRARRRCSLAQDDFEGVGRRVGPRPARLDRGVAGGPAAGAHGPRPLATVVVLGSAIVGTLRRSRREAASPTSSGSASPGDGAALPDGAATGRAAGGPIVAGRPAGRIDRLMRP